MAGRAPEIHQAKVELARVFVHAGAASDNLLELGHGAHLAVKRDEPTGLDIHPGREQARGRDQHRVCGFRVNEVVQLGLPLGIAAGDTHDVAVILGHQVGVLVAQGLAHPGRVLPVNAEDNCLLEAVAAFLEELSDLAGHQFGPFVQYQIAVKIPGVVEAVFNLVPIPVQPAGFGPVALHVAVDMDLDDFVGGQKPVVDALFQ